MKVVSNEAGRYNDPIKETGGPLLYGYADNNPISWIDPYGLWKIERAGEETALAHVEPGDTLTTLAKEIGLDIKDYKEWATVAEGGVAHQGVNVGLTQFVIDIVGPNDPLECGTVIIPNTVYVHWSGDLGRIGQGFVRWDARVGQVKSDGYKVIETHSTKGNHLYLQRLLEASASKKQLHGLVFQGHGSESSLGSGGAIPTGAPVATEVLFSSLRNQQGQQLGWNRRGQWLSATGMNLNYKMGLVILLSCESASGKSALYSNAPGGVFEAYKGLMAPVVNISTGGRETIGDPGRYAPPPDPEGRIILFEIRF